MAILVTATVLTIRTAMADVEDEVGVEADVAEPFVSSPVEDDVDPLIDSSIMVFMPCDEVIRGWILKQVSNGHSS